MAREEEERIKITFNTNADDARTSVDNVAVSIDKTIDKTEALDKVNKKTNKSQKDLTKTTKKQKASLDDLEGGIGGAIKGVKNLGKQFLLLIANPIILTLTAIVGTLALLFKAFTSTKEGGEQLDRIMSGLGAVVDVLRDRLLKIVDATKKLFTGDIIGAAKDYFNVFKGAGDEIVEEFNKASAAVKQLQEVADATRDLSVARAQLNRDLAESEQILQDENASYEEKKQALIDVKRLEGEQTEQELKNARRKLEAIQAQNALSDSSAESLQAEADAKIALFNLEQKSAEDRRKIADFNRTIDNQESARKKAIADEQRAQYLERKKRREAEQKEIEDFNKSIADKENELLKQLQDLQDDTAQQRLDRQKARDLSEIELLRQKGANVVELLQLNAEIYAEKQNELDEIERERLAEKREADLAAELEFRAKEFAERKNIMDAELAQKQALQNAVDSLGNQGIAAAKDLFNKNKTVQKGIIVAEGAVALGKLGKNVVEQVSQDNVASPLTFGMPWSGVHIAQGALGATQIISSTNKALQALGGGGSAGSPPILPTVRGASARPQTGFQASSENQIATSITDAQSEQPPIKAYVVTSEVTTGQNLDAKIINENSFG